MIFMARRLGMAALIEHVRARALQTSRIKKRKLLVAYAETGTTS